MQVYKVLEILKKTDVYLTKALFALTDH